MGRGFESLLRHQTLSPSLDGGPLGSTSCVICLSLWARSPSSASARPPLSWAADDPVVAIVNGDKVMRSEVEAAREALPQQYRQMPLEAIYDPLLARVIDSHLLEQQALKEDIEKRPDVQEALAQARLQVLRQQVIEIAVKEGSTDAAAAPGL